MFDLVLHVTIDMAEPLRIAGNTVGIAAALIVLLGNARAYAPHILAGAAAVVFVVNAIHASQHGFAIPMLVFIGVALFLLIRWAQLTLMEANPESEHADGRFYHRWWVALLMTLVLVGVTMFGGLSTANIVVQTTQSLTLLGGLSPRSMCRSTAVDFLSTSLGSNSAHQCQ
jgi:hypothetical protein